jgi:lysozyme
MNKARLAIGGLALSASAFVSLALHEGYRSKAYDDGVGVQTIGFGTTEGVTPGQTITVEKALVRALADVSKFEGAIKQCVVVPLHQHEYDAFSLLAYNIGPAAFCNSTLVRKLNAEDYAGACAEISRWNRAGGSVLAGLTKRREAERAQCEGRG